jgi:hypothetical protein
MVESCDELILEIAKETGLDHMGEEAEDEDDNNGGDTVTPPVAMAPPLSPASPVAATPEEVVEEEDPEKVVPAQDAPMVHEVILADAEPKLLQSRLYRMLVRDYEESPSRMTWMIWMT